VVRAKASEEAVARASPVARIVLCDRLSKKKIHNDSAEAPSFAGWKVRL